MVQVAVYNTQGQALATFNAYDEALGVRSLSWHPAGRLLAVGSCDKVRHRTCDVGPTQFHRLWRMAQGTGHQIRQQPSAHVQTPTAEHRHPVLLGKCCYGVAIGSGIAFRAWHGLIWHSMVRVSQWSTHVLGFSV